MKKLLLSLFSFGAVFTLPAQNILLTSQTQVISQNFDSLSASGTTQTYLPVGWWIAENPGNTTYRAGDGGSNTGDTYSFGTGTSSERALGSIASGSVSSVFGANIINNTSASLTQFSYDLFMEQWRSGGRTGLDSLYFSYSINNGVNGTWTRVASNDLVSKITQATASALDGNAAANRQFYSFTVTGLTWAVGDTLSIRWSDPNVGGNDDGLSIDNFNFTITGTLPVKYSSFTAKNTPDGNLLSWSTASEKNNHRFDIERSINNGRFELIASVQGVGNTNKTYNYSFTDADKNAGAVCYRLKQVDRDGNSNLSNTVCVVSDKKQAGVITTPNPFNDKLEVTYQAAGSNVAAIEVVDLLGKVHYSASKYVVNGSNTFKIGAAEMPQGIYFVRITSAGETTTQRIIKK